MEDRFCTFYLDSLWFGIEVQAVQEVLHARAITRVPLAPYAVAGLINLRGQIVTVADFRRRLGLPERPADRPPMTIVVRCENTAVGLLVDEIGEMVAAPPESFETVADMLPARLREVVTGVHKMPNGLLHVLALRHAVAVGN